jgi:hypothetical protein
MNHPVDAADRQFPTVLPATIGHVASPPLIPVEPVIDTKHLARMTLGDERLEREVLELFMRQADMLLGRMINQAPGVVVGLSHTLMGSARGVGAWKVADAAAALERIGKTPAVSAAMAINRLAEAVTEAKSAIANRYGPASEKSGSDLRFT